MPMQHVILQVFVASPSDVSEERKLLEGVIDELNRTWADSLGVTYRLYGFGLNVAPGFGVEPQAVINSQIPSEYDVFVGIFWGRIGSPTQNFSSGTVEEFERALARYELTGTPEIMIYFKDAPLSPSKIEPGQLEKLLSFKAELTSRGGLYSTFEDQDGFEASLRSHLSVVARKFSGPLQNIQKTSINPHLPADTVLKKTEDGSDDLGYLDYIDIYISETKKMTGCLGKINELTTEIGKKLNKRTDQINSAEGSSSKVRTFMLMSAGDMNQFSNELDGQLEIYRISKTASFDALSKSVALHNEINGKDQGLLDLQGTLKNLLPAISESRDGVLQMRDAAERLPRMIKEVNQAKRVIVDSLNRFLSEIDSTSATASNIVESIDQMV